MSDPASRILLLFLPDATSEGSFTTLITKFLAILILVALNGFFVMAEFALVSARRSRIEAKADAGSKRAKTALRLLDNPTLFISAVQLGVTLSSLALGWLGEPTIAALIEPIADRLFVDETALYIAHGVAFAIAFTTITFFHIVFGELLPKMMALEKAEPLALFASPPLEIFAKVCSPLLWVFNVVGGRVGKLIGLKSSLEHTAIYTEDEIRQLVDLSQKSGHLNREEQKLINQVFEFSDTTVKEAMIPRTEIAGIPETSDLEELARAFRRYGYSRLPVYRESMDDVIGVIHSKDVMPYLLNPRRFSLKKVLQSPIYVVDTARLEDVLRQMQKAKSHFAFVVDEHGGVEGILTLEDLLEEIVGDISDEHDEEVNEQISTADDGTFSIDAGLAVRDLNKRLAIQIPESDGYTTIAGFLMSEAGRLLEEGETVDFNGYKFQIEKVDKRRIIRVKLEKIEEAAPAEVPAE